MHPILSEVTNLKPQYDKLSKKHDEVDFEKECLFAKQALESNDYLMRVAENNKQSLFDAVLNTASIGISLNPALKRAYLVPRGRRVCLDVSYQGICHLAISTGAVEWVQARLVYEGDQFTLNSIDEKPTHIVDPFSKNRGEVIGAYCVAKLPSGDFLTEPMSKEEIDEIKMRSDGHKAFKSGKARSSIWESDFGEMAKKTVTKRASKYWPKNERTQHLDEVIAHDNQSQQLDSTDLIDDFKEKAELVEQIKQRLSSYCNGMSVEQKFKVLNGVFGVNRFDDLKSKSVMQLEDANEELYKLMNEDENNEHT